MGKLGKHSKGIYILVLVTLSLSFILSSGLSARALEDMAVETEVFDNALETSVSAAISSDQSEYYPGDKQTLNLHEQSTDGGLVASGICGTCPWSINTDGVLMISTGNLASNDDNSWTFWPWSSYRDKITIVVTNGVVTCGENLSYCFYNIPINSADLSGWNVSHVKSIHGMFSECESLESVNLTDWNTSNIEDMAYMFSSCHCLTDVRLADIDTHNLTSIEGMFRDCSSLIFLDLSCWDTSKVTDMDYVFAGCKTLEFLDLSSWDTSVVTGNSRMFSDCDAIKSLKVGSEYVFASLSMFPRYTSDSGCWWSTNDKAWYTKYEIVTNRSGIGDTYINTGDTPENRIASGTWGTCPWIVTTDGTLTVYPGRGSNMVGEFKEFHGKSSKNSNIFFTGQPWLDCYDEITAVVFEDGVILPENCQGLLCGLNSLMSADLSGCDASNVRDMKYLLAMTKARSIKLGNMDTSSVTDMSYMFSTCTIPKDVERLETSSVTDMSYMFSSSTYAGSLDLSGWDVSNVTSIFRIFYGAYIEVLTIDGWDCSSVSGNTQMFDGGNASIDDRPTIERLNAKNVRFEGCASLESMFLGSTCKFLDLSGWDVSQVNQFGSMFSGCKHLDTLDLTGWDVSAAENLGYMFENCLKLSSLGVSNWNVSSVKSFMNMFHGCTSLRSLDLSKWDVSGVQASNSSWGGFREMFAGCSTLNDLSLFQLDRTVAISLHSMFYGCSSLPVLDLSSWSIASGVQTWDQKMFDGCTSLEMISLSDNYFLETFPAATATNGKWWSTTAQSWFSVDEIISNRHGIADTYTNIEVPYEPSTPDGTSFATATPISFNTSYTGSLASYDSRYYRFVVPSGGRITYEATTTMTTFPVEVCDSSRHTLDGGSHTRPASVTSGSWSCANAFNLTAGSYFLKVGGAYSSVGDYQLTMSFASARESYPEAAGGNNNSVDKANKITCGKTYFGQIALNDDADYYAFTLPADSTINLMGSFVIGYDDIDIVVYDASGNSRLEASTIWNTALRFSRSGPSQSYAPDEACELSAGTYHLMVSGHQGVGSCSYSFTLDVLGTSEPNLLSSCTMTLSPSSYVYDGRQKTPAITVKDGSTALVAGKNYDVTTEPAGRTDAGTYTYVVTGRGDYRGTKSASFTITQADPTLSFTSTSVSKKVFDAPFTNALTKVTDGTVTFSSSDTNVASVNSSTGLVALKGEGETTITASATTGRNYEAGEATFILTVAKADQAIAASDKTVAMGKTVSLGAKISGDGELTYESSNTGIVTVNSSGTVTPVAVGTARVTIRASETTNYAAAAKTVTVTVTGGDTSSPHVSYRTHVQSDGWQGYVADGATSGTSGRSLRLEGINIRLDDADGGIHYRTHIESIGWESGWKNNDQMSGTSGRALRLEAIQIELTGDIAKTHDVWYRVHAQNVGWMGWAKNGAMAGTAAHAYRLEAIQIRLTAKGGDVPGTTSAAYLDGAGYLSGIPDSESSVLYRTHVENVGWQNWMRDGEMAGTTGKSYRLEGINMRLGGNLTGGIRYRTHIQNIGWEGTDDPASWKRDGEMSGTSGKALRLEAIQIDLTGDAATTHDIWYRVHAQNFGWLGWARNGESSGTAGYAYRLEGIEVRVLPKGSGAPGPMDNAFLENENAAAHAAYANLVKILAQRAAATGHSRGIDAYFRYADVYGNYVDELLVVTMESGGSGSTLRIYTYRDDKTQLMLEDGFYGDNEYCFYKDTSSFILYCSGHGGERYNYYVATDDAYIKIATRARVSTAGGGESNGTWAYTSYSGTTGSSITKAVFDRIVANIEKGTTTILTPSWQWQTMKA